MLKAMYFVIFLFTDSLINRKLSLYYIVCYIIIIKFLCSCDFNVFKYMFFTEGREEILNLNCEIINFIHCIKEKCNLDPQGKSKFASAQVKHGLTGNMNSV